MTKREDQARAYAAEQGWKYVKVYGSKGDRLTDEEREALKEACQCVQFVGTEKCFNTLRNLLERLK